MHPVGVSLAIINPIRLCVFLGMLIGLAGCSGNVRDQSAEAISQEVKHVAPTEPQGLAWFGPELMRSHSRILFYGYDTVSYRLAAGEPLPPPRLRAYRLVIDADYGGEPRRYDTVKFPDGSRRATANRRHEVERCQFFNSLVYACLFRDHVNVDLSPSELENAQTNGLQVILSSDSQDYETIDLPARYVRGFLAAVSRR